MLCNRVKLPRKDKPHLVLHRRGKRGWIGEFWGYGYIGIERKSWATGSRDGPMKWKRLEVACKAITDENIKSKVLNAADRWPS